MMLRVSCAKVKYIIKNVHTSVSQEAFLSITHLYNLSHYSELYGHMQAYSHFFPTFIILIMLKICFNGNYFYNLC
jgi:hypothetical protein